MNLYDAVCALCGTVNRNLYLDETGGWMECCHCRSCLRASRITPHSSSVKDQNIS